MSDNACLHQSCNLRIIARFDECISGSQATMTVTYKLEQRDFYEALLAHRNRCQALSAAVGYIVLVLSCWYALPFAVARGMLVAHRFLHWRGIVRAPYPVFYADNLLVINVVGGVAVGGLVYTFWRSSLTFIVFAPSWVIVAYRVFSAPTSILQEKTAAISHFISWGCTEISVEMLYISVKCADQIEYSVPMYASTGFSIGCLLHYLYRYKFMSTPRQLPDPTPKL